MTAPSQPKLVFVIGVWRSGTSLLNAMLNQHPQIALMFEAEPFGLFPLDAEHVWPDDWAARLDFYNQAVSRHKLDAAALPKKISGRECLLTLFRTWAARKNAAVMGGKSPTYHKWVPQIARIFPEAEFIIIWRDPIACCRSVAQAARQNRFFSQTGIRLLSLFGTEKLARGVEQIKRNGHHVHELAYEDLLTDPETELREICKFLGVAFDARMLDWQSADISMVPSGEHHDLVRSGRVDKDTRRAEILPEEFIAKIRRYSALWQERFAHLKLVRSLRVSPGQSRPDETERIGDWLAVKCLRSLWNFKRYIFRNVPLKFWVWLRAHNRRKLLRQNNARLPAGKSDTGRRLTFSIVTPSFRNSDWLKLCIASVADQQGVEFEHIVQDSCSDDGTQNWLPHDPRVKAFIEKDAGMYDAVNRGYRRATGDILAYLNCDEQYLPGALVTVREFFEANPEVEVALAGTIVTDGDGNYMCHRHSMTPQPQHLWFRFPMLTSSIFIRRKVIHERGIFFDTRWRDLGDFHWVLALMKNNVPVKVCDSFTSAFADTGENMNLKPNARREKAETDTMTPRWVQRLKPLWIVHHRLRRIAAGHFSMKATDYFIYTKKNPERRVTIDVPKPTAIWWNRL
jgi:glycosyltransferase involved in cell wall biosynthesis